MPEVYDIEKIIEAYDLLEYASRYTNLEERHEGDNDFWGICPNPEHLEKTASFGVNIENDIQFFNCLGCHWHGTIIAFVMKMENLSYYKAVEKLANDMNMPKVEISSVQLVSRKFKVKRAKKSEKVHIILPEDIMGEKTEEITEWLQEGISSIVMDEFQVRKNKIQKESIEFPIWDNNGNIINISRRTTCPDYKELKIPKYVYYNKIGCLDFFYGWYQNQEFIKQKNEIVLFEGAKSVFKAIDYGYSNACAILTSNMSTEQVKIIISNHIENVTFALDKGITPKKIAEMTTLLRHYCKVYYIDGRDLLEDKDSPVDKGKAVFDTLYAERKMIR